MSRIYRQLPEKGTNLGIAFSGGLDTRAAVAWLAEKGMKVYAYTADLAQPDEKNPADIPPIALEHGAVAAKLIDCRAAMVRAFTSITRCSRVRRADNSVTFRTKSPSMAFDCMANPNRSGGTCCSRRKRIATGWPR